LKKSANLPFARAERKGERDASDVRLPVPGEKYKK